MKPVLFSSKLSPAERRIYKAVTLLLVAVFFAFMWPVYPLFNRIRPLILGMPASLFYLVFLVTVVFVSILALYRWEDHHGKLEEADIEVPGGSAGSGGGAKAEAGSGGGTATEAGEPRGEEG